jgi:hypothetical protein
VACVIETYSASMSLHVAESTSTHVQEMPELINSVIPATGGPQGYDVTTLIISIIQSAIIVFLYFVRARDRMRKPYITPHSNERTPLWQALQREHQCVADAGARKQTVELTLKLRRHTTSVA